MNLDIRTNPEDLFQIIFKNLDDLIIIINSDWIIEFINKSVLKKILGYSKEDLVGKNINKLFHPEDRIEIGKMIKSLFNNKNINQEGRIKDKNGKWHWFDIYGELISYKKIDTKAVFILKDITQNREKLKEAEEKYRLITENAYDLISMFNTQIKFTYINEKTHKRILGYKKEDMIGKRLWKFIHPDDLQKAYNIIKNRLKKGLGRTILRFKKKDGTYIWLETVGVAFETNESMRLGVTISRDISERKKFEKLLKKQIRDRIEYEKELEKSEEKYRLITENANDLIGVFDEKLRITYINEISHKRILGYKKEDMIGKPLRNFIHPEEFESVFNKIKSEWKEGTGRAILRFKKKDGSYIWIETIAEAFKTKDNRLLGVTISRDISERKKFEELIQEENKKLKKLNKMRNNLINRVSHELKTPMTSVYGYIQLIEKSFQKNLVNEGLEMISIAKRGCKRLQNLIENILDASRIDASKLKINKEEINFGKIIKNCINELKYLIEKKQLVVEINITDNIKVFVDKLRIEEVIINLISNAIKNTPLNGKISISLVKSNNNAKFTIKDNGIGIGKEEIETLFTKFGKIERKQYQENINMEGSGLGLYISKKIIERHNGEIWAESEGRNKGSSFYFTLPIL